MLKLFNGISVYTKKLLNDEFYVVNKFEGTKLIIVVSGHFKTTKIMYLWIECTY